MADTARKVNYYSTTVPDQPGEAFRVLAALVSAGVNLLGCRGFQRGRRSQLDLVPDDARKFTAAMKRVGLPFSQKKAGFLIQGDDRPGALADNLMRLADRQINIASVDGLSAGTGRWAAIVWVDDADVRRAGRALRARSP